MERFGQRGRIYGVRFDAAALQLLADLAAGHAEPELCDHMHVYRGTEPLLEWYYAFDDPLYINAAVPEERVRPFSDRLQLRYSWQKAAV